MIPSSRALATAALVSMSFVGIAGVATAAPVNAAPAAIAAPQFATGPTSNAIVVGAVAALEALHAGDPDSYQGHLVEIAGAIAYSTGVSYDDLYAVWSTTDGQRMTAVLSALSQVGVKYRRNSSTPGGGFDCSGLTSWAWAQAGVELPHQSRTTINSISRTTREGLLPGDMIYYPGHIEMALGVGDAYVHAPGTGKHVEVKGGHRVGKRLQFGNPIG